MLVPLLLTRVENLNRFSSLAILHKLSCTFTQRARNAAKGKVFRFCLTTCYDRDDAIDMKCGRLLALLLPGVLKKRGFVHRLGNLAKTASVLAPLEAIETE